MTGFHNYRNIPSTRVTRTPGISPTIMKAPMQRRSLLALACLAAALSLPVSVLAQSYPSRPVRIVVPAATGSADVFARALARQLEPVLGQPVIVEQKPGAGTNIGNAFVAKAPPDGYTLLINGLPLATNPALYSNMTYSPSQDLVPVIQVAEIANVVTVHPSLGINSMRELVQAARSQPGKFNYGSPGAGSSSHLSAELLGVKTGAKFTHVPYQGNAQATNDHLAGLLQVGFVNMPVALQFVRANRLKALADDLATQLTLEGRSHATNAPPRISGDGGLDRLHAERRVGVDEEAGEREDRREDVHGHP